MTQYFKYCLVIIVLLVMNTTSLFAQDDLKVEVLIAGDWGKKAGDFGFEKEGKTEDGYALDFFLANDNIYILDSMNNRIQIFDLKGNLKEAIKLQVDWRNFGLPIDFALFQNHFYMLIGKPPYYSSNGIRGIHKFSYDGKFIKEFGKEYIPKGQEEYFNSILSNKNSQYLICSVGGIKVLAFDANDNLQRTLMKAKKKEVVELMGIDSDGDPLITRSAIGENKGITLLLDIRKDRIKNEVQDFFSLVDKQNDFYFIKTNKIRRKKGLITKIDIYNPETRLSKTFQISDDVKVIKNNKEKVYRYSGNFKEVAKVDAEGNIYHLIALEDGILLRKITWKSKRVK